MENRDYICLRCNDKCKELVCGKCKNMDDLVKLCDDLLLYHYTAKSNELWNNVIKKTADYDTPKDIVFDLADCFIDSRKIYYKLKSLTRGSRIVSGKEKEYIDLTEKYVLYEDVADYTKSICLAVAMNYFIYEGDMKSAEEFSLALKKLDCLSEFAISILCEYYRVIDDYQSMCKVASYGIELYSGKDVCMNYRNYLSEAKCRIESR